MNSKLEQLLSNSTNSWLVTGAAGFIGSHLVEALLKVNQKVIGLDDFSTGKKTNLEQIKLSITRKQWGNFSFVEGNICNIAHCRKTVKNVDYVLHHAASVSVPNSIKDPIQTHGVNVDGFFNLLIASSEAKIKRLVYASSSAVYGDNPESPKLETQMGKLLSPYALTKYVNECYSEVFSSCYNLEIVGLRYFNIFGTRQDPKGAYAAVIPKWIDNLLHKEQVYIYGDGENTRDFCFINDVIQANLLAATSVNKLALNQVYNVASGISVSLNQLFKIIKDLLTEKGFRILGIEPKYTDFRHGDIRFSQANISKARNLLEYNPVWSLTEGLAQVIDWHISNMRNTKTSLV